MSTMRALCELWAVVLDALQVGDWRGHLRAWWWVVRDYRTLDGWVFRPIGKGV